jgi:hypothetical protein
MPVSAAKSTSRSAFYIAVARFTTINARRPSISGGWFHASRVEEVASAAAVLLESFGESITELTRHVFETNEVSTHRRTLSRLAREEGLDATIARFERELSLSAQAFPVAQHEREGG